jgi:hypothetical protein
VIQVGAGVCLSRQIRDDGAARRVAEGVPADGVLFPLHAGGCRRGVALVNQGRRVGLGAEEGPNNVGSEERGVR